MDALELMETIRGTLKPCLKLNAYPVKDSELEIRDCKFGGTPYIPKDAQYPASRISEQPSSLLAQINFSQLPALEPFPTDGLLQFFIDPTNDDESGEFYVRYVSAYDAPSAGDLDFPQPKNFFKDTYKVSGALDHKPMSFDSPQIKTLFGELIKEDDTFSNFYFDCVSHKNDFQIGGYPSFVDAVPDFLTEAFDEYALLLQVDTKILGNAEQAGVASFFTRKEDLWNLDFSNAKYFWEWY